MGNLRQLMVQMQAIRIHPRENNEFSSQDPKKEEDTIKDKKMMTTEENIRDQE